ncbi:MAG: glycosyl transferase [Flaviaesturariibacter sp.]|nr:glycosyl transferase [Flaviaesturariibacter sp.]
MRTLSRPSAALLLITGFVLLKLLLHLFLIDPIYDLHRDEYLHLDQANHLAGGYVSVPPLSSWVALLIKALGNGTFWVKAFPALFGALTITIAIAIVYDLGGGLFAQALTGIALIFSVILRINILFQPNSFDILAWTAIYYFLIRYVKTKDTKWLFACAVAMGFGFLNKYNILFLFAGLLPALLLTHPLLFLRRQTYLAGILALFIVMPNLIWQWQNGFPVMSHMKELAETQLANNSRGQFLLEQALSFLGSFYLIVLGLLSLWRWPAFRAYRFVAYSFVIVLLIFTWQKAKGYYAFGLYPVLIAFGATYLEGKLRGKRFGLWLRPVLFLLTIGLFLPPFYALFPVLSPPEIVKQSSRFKPFGVLRWEDGKDHLLPQDFADMQGWKELAQKTERVFESLPDKQTTLVLCNNYGETGAINYYKSSRGFQAVSFNADYVSWFPMMDTITSVVRIKEEDDPVSVEEKQLFGVIKKMDSIENGYAREKGTVIYLMTASKANIASLIREKVKKVSGK